MSNLVAMRKAGTIVLLSLGLVCLTVFDATKAAVEEGFPSQYSITTEPHEQTAEPFGLAAFLIQDGPLVTKWGRVREKMQSEMEVIALCRASIEICPSPAAIEFLSIVERARLRDGLARAGEVNRSINLDIRPADDLDQYHVNDYWSSPLATLTSRAGDCEDYAIAKFLALSEAGIASQDLRLVILHNRLSHEDHAVVTVRVENRWRVLDNRGFLMLEDSQYTRYQPLFLISESGIRRYADSPQVIANGAPAQPYF